MNAASAINSSPVVVYPQFIADNELSDSFPEFEMLTRLTLPVGICSAKRTFSVLRQSRNYLRSAMQQQRTSDLEQEVAE